LMVGTPVGFYLLQRGWVDCEGYDLISYMTGKQGRESKVGKVHRKKRQQEQEPRIPKKTPEEVRAMLNEQIGLALSQGNLDVAVALHEKLSAQQPGCGWEREHLVAIIRGYLKSQQYEKASYFIRAHIDHFSENRFEMHVRLLKIMIQQQRPRKVLRYIKSMPLDYLSDPQKQELRKIAIHAKKQIKDGVLEVE
ncbi:MAG: hypothetical protein AAF483_24750, partial [Planctomycetota bacterium]